MVTEAKDEFLWRFHVDCGRHGSIESLFVATEAEIENLIGKTVYFGEILGKHSDVSVTVDRDEVQRMAVSPQAVAEVVGVLGKTWSGRNPLVYLEEMEG